MAGFNTIQCDLFISILHFILYLVYFVGPPCR